MESPKSSYRFQNLTLDEEFRYTGTLISESISKLLDEYEELRIQLAAEENKIITLEAEIEELKEALLDAQHECK